MISHDSRPSFCLAGSLGSIHHVSVARTTSGESREIHVDRQVSLVLFCCGLLLGGSLYIHPRGVLGLG